MKLETQISSLKEITEKHLKAFVLLLATAAVISFAMKGIWGRLVEPDYYRVGQIATKNVRAHNEFVVEDVLNTQRLRANKAEQIPPVYHVYDSAGHLTSASLNALFQALAGNASENTASGGNLRLDADKRASFERKFRINLEGEEWGVISDLSKWPELEAMVSRFVDPILKRGIVSSKRNIHADIKSTGIVLRPESSNKEIVVYSASQIYDLREAQQELAAAFPDSAAQDAFKSLARKLSERYLEPNIVIDRVTTKKRQAAARAQVAPIVSVVKRGETIVRVGERVTAETEFKLAQLRQIEGSGRGLEHLLGYIVVCVLVIGFCYIFVVHGFPAFRPTLTDLALLSGGLIGSFVVFQVFYIIGEGLSLYFSELGSGLFLLAAPIASGGMILQVTQRTPSVFFFILCFSVLTGVFIPESWELIAFVALGNIVGMLSVTRCGRRSVFITAGSRIALVNVVIACCAQVISSEFQLNEATAHIFCAVLGGITSGIFAVGITPIVEHFGSYITDIKLLELASLDHPLLRELSLQSPGTWNHSMVIGQMGEVAADAIGANGLLTRVGSYYHDVGKAKKPAYFVENQVGIENPHDKLKPSMSALIIRTHVKDGLDMARQHRLPKVVSDFIPQHHGTGLISYFYDKAVKAATDGENVDDARYRYPGPKPQTKEAGILMLADSVEASSRTLKSPTPAKIQGLVQKILNSVFTSGQLDESELTLRDLHVIARNFTFVLTSIYHRRVEYAEPAEKKHKPSAETKAEDSTAEVAARRIGPAGLNASNGEKQQSNDEHRSSGESGGRKKPNGEPAEKQNSEGSQDTIKRLGITKS